MCRTTESINKLVENWFAHDWRVIQQVLGDKVDPPTVLDYVKRKPHKTAPSAPVFRAIYAYVRDGMPRSDMPEPMDKTGLAVELAIRTAVAACETLEGSGVQAMSIPEIEEQRENRIAQLIGELPTCGQNDSLLVDKALDFVVAKFISEGWGLGGWPVKKYLIRSITILLAWLHDRVPGFLWDESGDPGALANKTYYRLVLARDQGGPCQCCRGALEKVSKELETDPDTAKVETLRGRLPESNEVRSVIKCYNRHRLDAFLVRWKALIEMVSLLGLPKQVFVERIRQGNLPASIDICAATREAGNALEMDPLTALEQILTEDGSKVFRKALLKRLEVFSMAAFLCEAVRNSYGDIAAEGVKSGMIWPLLQEEYHLEYRPVAICVCPKQDCGHKSLTLDFCQRCGTNLEKVGTTAMDAFVVLQDSNKNELFRPGTLPHRKTPVLFWLGPPKTAEFDDLGSAFLDDLAAEGTHARICAAVEALVAKARRQAQLNFNTKFSDKLRLVEDGKPGLVNFKKGWVESELGRILDHDGFEPEPELSFLAPQLQALWAGHWDKLRREWSSVWGEVQDNWDATRNPLPLVLPPDLPEGQGDARSKTVDEKEIMDRFWKGLRLE